LNKRIACSVFTAFALTLPALALADEHDHDRDRDRDRDRHEEHAAAHHYHKGERLKTEEYRNEYVVNDWRERRLHEPPHGYHWVRNGDDFVLAAIATGVIADVVLNH
jgi:Ni/Co efflux regulator RcnB